MVDNTCRIILEYGIRDVCFRAHKLDQILICWVQPEQAVIKIQCKILGIVHRIEDCTTFLGNVLFEANIGEIKFTIIDSKDDSTLERKIGYVVWISVRELRERVDLETSSLVALIFLKEHTFWNYFRL